MSSEWELDEGIKSIKSAWRREHTARANLEKMLEQTEAENAKLRELAGGLGQCAQGVDCEDCLLYDLSEPDHCREERLWRELKIEVDV